MDKYLIINLNINKGSILTDLPESNFYSYDEVFISDIESYEVPNSYNNIIIYNSEGYPLSGRLSLKNIPYHQLILVNVPLFHVKDIHVETEISIQSFVPIKDIYKQLLDRTPLQGTDNDDEFYAENSQQLTVYSGLDGHDTFFALQNSRLNTFNGNAGEDIFCAAGSSRYNIFNGGIHNDKFCAYASAIVNRFSGEAGDDEFYDLSIVNSQLNINKFYGDDGRDYFISFSPNTFIRGGNDQDVIIHHLKKEYENLVNQRPPDDGMSNPVYIKKNTLSFVKEYLKYPSLNDMSKIPAISLFGDDGDDILISSIDQTNISNNIHLVGGYGNDTLFSCLLIKDFVNSTNMRHIPQMLNAMGPREKEHQKDDLTPYNRIVLHGGEDKDQFVFSKDTKNAHIYIEDFDPKEDTLVFDDSEIADIFIKKLALAPFFKKIDFIYNDTFYHFNTKGITKYSYNNLLFDSKKIEISYDSSYLPEYLLKTTYTYQLINFQAIQDHLHNVKNVRELKADQILSTLKPETSAYSLNLSNFKFSTTSMSINEQKNFTLKTDENGQFQSIIKNIFSKTVCEQFKDHHTFSDVCTHIEIPKEIIGVIVQQYNHGNLYFTTETKDNNSYNIPDSLEYLDPKIFLNDGKFIKCSESTTGSVTLKIGFVIQKDNSNHLEALSPSLVRINF